MQDRRVVFTDEAIRQRLLPGDPAPPISTKPPLTDEQRARFARGRARVVMLWNAGCSACMPVIETVSSFGVEHGIPCLAVAVLTRNPQATAIAVASAGHVEATFAEEEPHPTWSPMARGSMTRQWLEASGIAAIPAGYIVDQDGVVAWMGNPYEMMPVLTNILCGRHDIQAERKRMAAEITDDDIAIGRICRHISELLLEGRFGEAREAAELTQARYARAPENDGFQHLLTILRQLPKA